MLVWSATFMLLAWASVPSAARPQHLPLRVPFSPRPPSASELELQRVGGIGLPGSQHPVARSGDYSDAVYAGQLAKELTRLEEAKNSVYVDFISSLYMNPQVSRGFPPDLQRLSRGAPSLGPRRVIASTSSSFGAPPPASFGVPVHPGAPGFPFGRAAVRR